MTIHVRKTHERSWRRIQVVGWNSRRRLSRIQVSGVVTQRVVDVMNRRFQRRVVGQRAFGVGIAHVRTFIPEPWALFELRGPAMSRNGTSRTAIGQLRHNSFGDKEVAAPRRIRDDVSVV